MLFPEWQSNVTRVHSNIKILDDCLQSQNVNTSYFSSISQQIIPLF